MKNLFVLFVFFCGSLFAQVPAFSWAKSFVTVGTNGGGNGVTVDPQGNVYTLFNFKDSVDLDPGPGVFAVSGTSLIGNQAIVKLDAGGNFLWGASFTATLMQATAFATDNAGNLYVSGYFDDTVDFDPGPGVKMMTSVPAYHTAFVMKLQSNGQLVWAKSFTGKSFNVSLALDKNADLFLTGYYMDNVDFDPGPANVTLQSTNKDQAFVAKLDSSGQFLWVKQFVSDVYCYGEFVELDTAGFICLSGRYWGNTDFDPGSGTQILNSTKGDSYLVKLDKQGNFVFVKNWYGWYITNISIDPDNNINLGFYLRAGITDLDPGAGVHSVSVAKSDFAIIQLDDTGNFNWAKTSGGSAYLRGICNDRNGNIYAGGGFDSIIDLDLGPGTYTVPGPYMNPTTSFMIILDKSGNHKWAGTMKSSGSINSGFAYMVNSPAVVDDHGNIYLGGICNGDSCDLDPSNGTHFITSDFDGMITKLSLCLSPDTMNQPLVLCGNSAGTSLSATGSGTITWYSSPTSSLSIGTGSTFITPLLGTGTSTYFAEASSCVGEFERTPYVVLVSPQPTVQLNNLLPVMCAGETTTVQLSGASVYSVNGTSVPSTFTLAPASSGTLAVTGSNAGKCMDTVVFFQLVDVCAGLDEPGSSMEKIYPNPVSDKLYVEVQGSAFVTVYNLSGQKLIEAEVTGSESLDVSSLGQGLYVVDIIKNGQPGKRIKLVKH